MTARSDAIEARWQEARDQLVDAAKAAGIESGIVIKIAGFESGFNPQARPVARNAERNTVRQFDGVMAISSAHGYGQFLDGTWAMMVRGYGERYGVTNASELTKAEANDPRLRNDPRLQAAMLAEFTRENMAKGERLGGPDAAANAYAFHNLGDSDATKFLNALRQRPDDRVDSVLSSAVIRGNPGLYGDGSRTVAAAYVVMGQHMDRYDRFAREVEGRIAAQREPHHGVHDSVRRQPETVDLLEQGDHGAGIRQLQSVLMKLGYRDADGQQLVADGDFGRRTREAVQAFQRAHGLQDDGVVGPKTHGALAKAEHFPLLSDPVHPSNGLYCQGIKGLQQLPAGAFRNEVELHNAAGGLAAEARRTGLQRIDHVLLSTNGNLFAVQGGLHDPAHQLARVDRQTAAAQSVERSTELLNQSEVERLRQQQAETQMQHLEHRGLTVGMRP